MSNPVIKNMADAMAAYNKAKNSDAETVSRQPKGYFEQQSGQQKFVKFNRSCLNGLDVAMSTKADFQDYRRPGHADAVKYYAANGNDDDRVFMRIINAAIQRDGAEQYTPRNLAYEQKMLVQIKNDGTARDVNLAAKAKDAITESWTANGYLTPNAPVVFGRTVKHTPLTYRDSIQQSLEKTHLEYFSDEKLLAALRLVKGSTTTAANLMRTQRAAIQSDADRRREKLAEQVSPEEKERYKS